MTKIDDGISEVKTIDSNGTLCGEANQDYPIIFLYKDEKKHRNSEFVKVFEKAAKAHKSKKVKFCYSHLKKGMEYKIAKFSGVIRSELPMLKSLVANPNVGLTVYEGPVTPEKMTVENLGQYADDILAGTNLQRYYQSEKPPIKNDSPVTIIVGKEFKKIALDVNKDVFVTFYDPDCEHCKNLAPHWEKLAKHYEGNNNMVIANFDHTKNEAENVEIELYPTLILYTKQNKNGIKYDGSFEFEPIKKWVEKKALNDQLKDEL